MGTLTSAHGGGRVRAGGALLVLNVVGLAAATDAQGVRLVVPFSE